MGFTVSTFNTRLTHFHHIENITWRDSGSMHACHPKWDAPSLPLLSSLPLTSLHISHLSQSGARSLSALLSDIGEDSLLDDISIDIVWLDDALCENIVKAGRRLRSISLGTRGTKLSDKGVASITEGCEGLEHIVLDEVQGRLTRSLWSKPTCYPAGMRTFRIAINESGPHHSWTVDHLESIAAIPFSSLQTFAIVRKEPSPRISGETVSYPSAADDITCLKPVPEDIVAQLRQATSLTSLECDWWAWGLSDIKSVLECCTELMVTIKICVDAPCAKFLGLASNFATLVNLRTLSFSINPAHAPGTPPMPLVPLCPSSIPTPCGTPEMNRDLHLPQFHNSDHPPLQASISANDPSMPLMRDVKRFVRKCPKLQKLEWFGKSGRGTWIMTRGPSAASKSATTVAVAYQPPKISENLLNAVMRYTSDVDAEQKGTSRPERAGQAWIGETAAAFAAERSAEIDKEQASSAEKDKHGRSRENHRRMRTLSVSTSSQSGENMQLPTPTDSTHSASPVSRYSPLIPSNHDEAQSAALPVVAEGAEQVWSNGIDHVGGRRRAPSESATNARTHAVPRRRTHSSSNGTKDKGERHEFFSSRGGASGSTRGSSKHRGSAGARATKKRASGTESEPAPAQEGQPSRRSRGYNRGAGQSASTETGSRRRTAS
ncbi:hypothetical protein HWV62_39148 [Athelia sp. TMB]|nr:hypothetical protein HWV62_39148 [Athelia sp. TMB]